MSVENEKRLSVRRIEINFGTRCNLKCRHCLMGNPEPMAIKPEYIDALIDNVRFIYKLILTGGEATCHISEIKMILEKIAESDVRVDHIGINSNCFEFSEELANILNDFNSNHTLTPKKSKFGYSTDKFHFEAGLTKERLEENLRKYKSILKDFEFVGNDLDGGISIIGRAKELKKQDIDFKKGIEIPYNDGVYKLKIEDGCIHEGMSVICPNGYVYSQETIANCGMANEDYRYSLGNILDAPLFDLINQYNEKNKDVREHTNMIFYDEYNPIWVSLSLLFMTICAKRDIMNAVENDDKEAVSYSLNKIYEYLEDANRYGRKILWKQFWTRVEVLATGQKIFKNEQQKKLFSGELRETEEEFFSSIGNGMIFDYQKLTSLTNQYFENKDEETKKQIFDICKTNTCLEFVKQDTILKMFYCFLKFDTAGYAEQWRAMLGEMGDLTMKTN